MPFGKYSSMEDCIADNQDKENPAAFCAWMHKQITGTYPSQKEYSPSVIDNFIRHSDFEKIFQEFTKYYCKEQTGCDKGINHYYQWLKDVGLDEKKPYGRNTEAFRWTHSNIQQYREDASYKYYKVLIGFPLESMNGNIYTERELQATAHTLKGAIPTLNHKDYWSLENKENKQIKAEWVDSNYEDGAVEAILKVHKELLCPDCSKRQTIVKLIDEKKIVNVSLEASCNYIQDQECRGMVLTNASLLTVDTLAGIPLSRIFPMESFIGKALKGADKKLVVKVITRKEETPPSGNDASLGTTEPCPEGQHYDESQGMCVPDEPEQQGTENPVGDGISDNSHKPVEGKQTEAKTALEISNLKLEIFKTQEQYKLKNIELEELKKSRDAEILNINKSLKEEILAHTELKGKVQSTKEQLEKVEKQLDEKQKEVNQIYKTNLELISKMESMTRQNEKTSKELSENRDYYRTELEKLKQVYEEINKKYEELLSQNLVLTKSLRERNDEYLVIKREAEANKQELANARRKIKAVLK